MHCGVGISLLYSVGFALLFVWMESRIWLRAIVLRSECVIGIAYDARRAAAFGMANHGNGTNRNYKEQKYQESAAFVKITKSPKLNLSIPNTSPQKTKISHHGFHRHTVVLENHVIVDADGPTKYCHRESPYHK